VYFYACILCFGVEHIQVSRFLFVCALNDKYSSFLKDAGECKSLKHGSRVPKF
jgi:hypothetical protein